MQDFKYFGCSELFVAANGSAIVYYATSVSNGHVHCDIAISPDGELFYELTRGSSSSSRDHFEATLQDDRNDDTVTVDGVQYYKQETPRSFKFVALPEVRVTSYLFALPDGNVIYVSHDHHHFAYETMRFYMGPWDNLQRIRVHDVDRYRDGGTTNIFTAAGVMHSPSPFKEDEKAIWTPHHAERVELMQLPHDLVVNEEVFNSRAVMESDPRSFV